MACDPCNLCGGGGGSGCNCPTSTRCAGGIICAWWLKTGGGYTDGSLGPCDWCSQDGIRHSAGGGIIKDMLAGLNNTEIQIAALGFGGGGAVDGCHFQSANLDDPEIDCPAIGPGFGFQWQMFYMPGSAAWRLQIILGGRAAAVWADIPDAAFNCLGDNTFKGPPAWFLPYCAGGSDVTVSLNP